MRHIDYYTDLVMCKENNSGGGGGITPSGTKAVSIVQNGITEEDVTTFEKVKITTAVPEPEGEKVIDIVNNGTTTEDVKQYASAKINVNVPEPSGTLDITTNGEKDVKQYAKVNVQVPQEGITPEGTKEIEVSQNGHITEDVTEFANVHITTSVPEPSGTLTIKSNGKQDVKQYAEVDVQVPAPTGERSVTYTENKTVDEDVSELGTLHVTVNVPEPTGEKTIQITQNGETVEDIKQYASARINVQVPTGGGGEYQSKYETFLKTLLNPGSISDDNLLTLNDDDIVSLRKSAFCDCEILCDVNLQNLESTGDYVFRRCTNMKTFSAHKLTTVRAYAFSFCKKLVSVDLPEVVSVQSAAFDNCMALKKLVLPKCKSMDRDDIFRPSAIVTIDMLGGTDGKFACNMYMVSSFQTLVLRDTNGVTTLTGRFKETVSIYVPDALVEQYKSATNWTKYATQIKPLSEYVEV